MKKNKTNLILITSILFLFFISFSLFYFLNIIKNKNNHTSAVISTLNEKNAEKKNINALEKRMQELGNTRSQLNSYFVDTSHIDTFVGYLENIGTSNNVNLSVKSVELSKTNKNKISLSLSMDGDFAEVMKVMGILENSPYDIMINSVYLNKDIAPILDLSNITPTTNKKNVLTTPTKTSWQADVTFSVLSL